MRRTSCAGYSLLLECLIGLAIFLVAMLMTFGLYPAAHGSQAQAQEIDAATQLAHQILERNLSQPWDSVVSVPSGPDTRVALPRRLNGVQADLQLLYQVDVVQKPAPSRLKSIAVTVKWKHSQQLKSLTIQSYKGAF